MLILINLITIVLVVIAWGLPIMDIARKWDLGTATPIVSLTCAGMSAVLQMMELAYRGNVGGGSGVDDTAKYLAIACGVVVIGCLILNLIARAGSKLRKK